jgi:eukaryotic-like serine/threonine-protein kinase
MPLAPGTHLGPYIIDALLGSGGMGDVYRARDERLGRVVAVKMLGGQQGVTPDGLDRFEREARAVAALSHPNIVVLHDLGRYEDTPYAVMELVEGRTLRDLIVEGPLGLERALHLAGDTIRALVAAHEKGIIHRDLKPENLVVTADDSIKVLDFGLAHVTALAGSDVTMAVTAPGTVLGTIGYAPPEQLRGDQGDHRVDIFSMGVILQEMLTGRAPFARPTAVDTLAAVLAGSAEPPPASMPPAIAALIHRCLAADPAQRFPSARALAGALEAVKRTEATGYDRRRQPPPGRSLALIPFSDLSPAHDQEYVCEGIADELVTTLGRIPDLDLAARSATRAFKDARPDPQDVGRQLNVASVLEGSVRRSGGRLRVTVQLSDAVSGRQLWSERFDGDMGDVFALQDLIAGGVAGKLQPDVIVDEAADGRRGTTNVQAYTLWLQGRHLWNRRVEAALAESAELFGRAIALDPGYAQAHAGLADAFVMLGVYGALAPREAMERARAASERALHLDARLPEPHAALGTVKAVYDWDWTAAEREFRAALDLDYGHPRVHQWYAIHHLVPQGRLVEAAREMQAALAVEPGSPVLSMTAALVPFFSGRYEQALEGLRRTIAIDPSFAMAHFFAAFVHTALGDHDAAIQSIETAAGLGRSINGNLAYVLAQAGHRDRALAALAEMEQAATRTYVSPVGFALAYLGLQDVPRALAALAEAEAVRAMDLTWLLVHPAFEPLHANPAFRAITERVGLVDPRRSG